MSLPIYDREKRPMTVGSRFRYLPDTPYECEIRIDVEKYSDEPLAVWHDGQVMQLSRWWYAPTDEPNSILIT